MRNRRSSIEDLRLMLLSVSDDVRVLLVLLCERVYVLDHLAAVPPAERRRVCRDVLGLFAPVAARLGIHTLKQRLEGRAFPVVYPNDAALIQEQLAGLHVRYGNFLPVAANLLKQELMQEGISSVVEGREKLSYSIFTKMRAKSFTTVDKLQDLFALRVLVSSSEECYRALGALHRLGRPASNRFKDYISFPKPNGYQSLHTTVARLPGVPDGVFVEVQIRTASMHREAELGIAAHWSYKEGGTAEHAIRRVQLQQMLTAQQHIEGVGKGQHLADHIFVLTPKGDIVELPEGATPLDFAFQIHTHLGLAFRAAKVNGNIVPLDYELENGDVIEILSHRIPSPSPDWMQLLKMASSRSRLKRHLYAQHRDEYIAAGKGILNEELRKHRKPPLDTDLTALRTIGDNHLTFSEREDVLMKLGQGADRAGALFHQMFPFEERVPDMPAAVVQSPSGFSIEIEGGVPMPLRYAKCCKPEAGLRERILGFVTRTGEVTIHRDGCRMVKQANPERRIGVKWREAGKRKKVSKV